MTPGIPQLTEVRGDEFSRVLGGKMQNHFQELLQSLPQNPLLKGRDKNLGSSD